MRLVHKKVARDVEAATQGCDELEAQLKLCVSKAELHQMLDLDADDGTGSNPLRRMKDGLERSLAASAAAAEARAAAELAEQAR